MLDDDVKFDKFDDDILTDYFHGPFLFNILSI